MVSSRVLGNIRYFSQQFKILYSTLAILISSPVNYLHASSFPSDKLDTSSLEQSFHQYQLPIVFNLAPGFFLTDVNLNVLFIQCPTFQFQDLSPLALAESFKYRQRKLKHIDRVLVNLHHVILRRPFMWLKSA